MTDSQFNDSFRGLMQGRYSHAEDQLWSDVLTVRADNLLEGTSWLIGLVRGALARDERHLWRVGIQALGEVGESGEATDYLRCVARDKTAPSIVRVHAIVPVAVLEPEISMRLLSSMLESSLDVPTMRVVVPALANCMWRGDAPTREAAVSQLVQIAEDGSDVGSRFLSAWHVYHYKQDDLTRNWVASLATGVNDGSLKSRFQALGQAEFLFPRSKR